MEYSEYPSPPFKRENSTPAWVTYVGGMGCIFIALVILYPVFAQPHAPVRSISCMSNLRQLGTGILMYAQDYDDTLPRSTRWMDEIYPYEKSIYVYHCPAIAQKDSLIFGYAYQGRLSGKKLKRIAAPTATVLLYDSENTGWNASDSLTSLPDPPRHAGGNNCGYVDGHVKKISFQAIQSSSNTP